MDIKRINSYNDERFSRKALIQHGCFIIDNRPYEVIITSQNTALVIGENRENFLNLINEFIFYSPQIVNFIDEKGKQIISFPEKEWIKIDINQIQPSQFFVDQDKVSILEQELKDEKDFVIQVIKKDDKYISLDGHTRLFIALKKKLPYVYGIISETDDYIYDFVNEAKRRNIYEPKDLKLLSHSEYEVKWNFYCDNYFENKNKEEIDKR